MLTVVVLIALSLAPAPAAAAAAAMPSLARRPASKPAKPPANSSSTPASPPAAAAPAAPPAGPPAKPSAVTPATLPATPSASPPAAPGAAAASARAAPPAVTGGTVLLALDTSPVVAAALARLAGVERARGAHVLRADEISQRLCAVPASCPLGPDGRPLTTQSAIDPADAPLPAATPATAGATAATGDRTCYRPPDEEELARMLVDARLLESNFEGAQAAALRRHVIDIFNRTPQPSPRQRLLTGEAWLDLANGYAADGNMAAANTAARDAMRHFSDTPIDTMRFSPPLQAMFAAARTAVASEPQIAVRIRSTVPGRLFADGNELGRVERELTATLAAGSYRLWVQPDAGPLSLPYPMSLTDRGVAVEVDPAIDARLSFTVPVRLQCEPTDCPALLGRLRVRLGAEKVVAVRSAPGGSPEALVVQASDSTATSSTSAAAARGAPALESAKPAVASAVPAFVPIDSIATEPSSAPGLFALWRRHPGSIIGGGLGVLALLAGSVLGLQSRASFRDAGDHDLTQLQHNDLNQRGRDRAMAANILFGAAGAAAATAGVLLVIEW